MIHSNGACGYDAYSDAHASSVNAFDVHLISRHMRTRMQANMNIYVAGKKL